MSGRIPNPARLVRFLDCWQTVGPGSEQGRFQLAKDKQKKHDAAEVTVTSGKMPRKEFEKELAKLQVEPTDLGPSQKSTHYRGLRRPGYSGQGRRD
jgi:hypothetical protein